MPAVWQGSFRRRDTQLRRCHVWPNPSCVRIDVAKVAPGVPGV